MPLTSFSMDWTPVKKASNKSFSSGSDGGGGPSSDSLPAFDFALSGFFAPAAAESGEAGLLGTSGILLLGKIERNII